MEKEGLPQDKYIKNLQLYHDVLKQALADGVLTNDENAILGIFRSRASIPDEIHYRMAKYLIEDYGIAPDPAYTKRVLKVQGKFRTDQGVMVRSKAEREIANFLFRNWVVFSYEPLLWLKNRDGKPHSITPDFYLPEHKIYIEFLGMMEKEDYRGKWEFKKELYATNNVQVITLVNSEEQYMLDVLKRKLIEMDVKLKDEF